MRAILIDPEKRTFTKVEINRGIEAVYKILGCETFTTGAYLNGSIEGGFDTVWVSDDTLSEEDSPRHWFQVDADRDPPASYPICGLGLVVGIDHEGETVEPRINVAELAKRISFTQRKFRGFEILNGAGQMGDHVVEMIKVDLKAPIIDGTDEH